MTKTKKILFLFSFGLLLSNAPANGMEGATSSTRYGHCNCIVKCVTSLFEDIKYKIKNDLSLLFEPVKNPAFVQEKKAISLADAILK